MKYRWQTKHKKQSSPTGNRSRHDPSQTANLRRQFTDELRRHFDRLRAFAQNYDPSQERDYHGRWTSESGGAAGQPAAPAAAGGLPGPRELRRSLVGLEPSRAAAAVSTEPLAGLPPTAKVPGLGEVKVGPSQHIRQVAADYMAEHGLPYNPPRVYVKVDKERAARIAAEYDKMPHAPDDPQVKAAYEQMGKEVIAQYQAAIDHGLKVEFIDFAKQGDPYAASPRLAIQDIQQNNHMWVFPTSAGFGTDTTVDVSNNPLLKDTGYTISGQPACVNDLFRVVHDYFGHAKEGVGMRADGEENAWRSHSAMFSPLARRAMTSETRGQNSWVNYGPYGEFNRKASGATTHYADQKTGLLPDWVVHEGAGDPPIHNEGEGRGFFKHAGRPGQLGGSAPSAAAQAKIASDIHAAVMAGASHDQAGQAAGAQVSATPTTSPQQDYAEHGVEAKSFKNWFGDWQNPRAVAAGLVSRVINKLTGKPAQTDPIQPSKVTDESGKPIIVFHGTKAHFDAFDPEHSNPQAALGRGFYFSESERGAQEWGGGNIFRGKQEGEEQQPVNVMKCYLNIKKPFDADAHLANLFKNPGLAKFGYEMISDAMGGNDKATKYLIDHGFDGITHMGKNIDGTPARVWIAFHPNQVKHVQNKGTFSPDDNSVFNAEAVLQAVHNAATLGNALPPRNPGEKPRLAVDIDGTLADIGNARMQDTSLDDIDAVPIRQDVAEAVRQAHDAGWEILIWTVRDDDAKVKAWLDKHNVPWDYFNENPDQPTDSPKIFADRYVDDRGVSPDVFARDGVAALNQAALRQPVKKSIGYAKLSKKCRKAIPELKALLGRLGFRTMNVEDLDVDHDLNVPGGMVITSPVKGRERSLEKVRTDYGGDWGRLFDIVRAAVAVDSLAELKQAVDTIGGDRVRVKNRFERPFANGYRDYLVNYRLPSGLICEIQFHVKPILQAREKEKLPYGIIRSIKNAMKAEGRTKMTPSEAVVVHKANEAGKRLLAEAWKQVKDKRRSASLASNYDPSEARDKSGRWTAGSFPVPRDKALASGYLFHGMSEPKFQEFLKSEGFEGGGFSDTPQPLYGPRYLAIRQQDLPRPSFRQGGGSNVQYSFTEPHPNLTPLRSEEEAKKWGQAYAFPFHLIMEADKEGNILGPLPRPTANYDPSEARDERGRWTNTGSVPAEPGTTPIPEGHIRLYSYSKGDPKDIRSQGLLLSKARGHTYGEPDVVWGSTLYPEGQHNAVVEYHIPASDASHDANYPDKGEDLRAWEKRNQHVTTRRDIKPEEIIAVHEPWHDRYRYIKNNPKVLQDTLAGKHDHLLNDPEYGPAVQKAKEDYEPAPKAKLYPDYPERDLPYKMSREQMDLIASQVKAQNHYYGTVNIVDGAGKEFNVGDRRFAEGGHCVTVKRGDAGEDVGTITIFNDKSGWKQNAFENILTHEMMHGKWAKVWDTYHDEKRKVMEIAKTQLANGVPSKEQIVDPSDKLRPEFVEHYPTYARFFDTIGGLYDSWESYLKDDGVTPYSQSYWQDFAAHRRENNSMFKYFRAVHETLSEIAAIEHYTGKVAGTERWKRLYRRVNDEYDKLAGAKKKRRVLAGEKKEDIAVNILGFTGEDTFYLYLGDNFQPTTPDQATWLHWNKGDDSGWARAVEPPHAAYNYSPDQPRDERGRFGTTGHAIHELHSRLGQPDSGFTYHLGSGKEPKTGYIVSPHPERSEGFDVDKIRPVDLARFLKKNKDLLTQEHNFFGAWHDPDSHRVFLDVVVHTDNEKEAEKLALDKDQIAYFDLYKGKSVTVNPQAKSGKAVANTVVQGIMERGGDGAKPRDEGSTPSRSSSPPLTQGVANASQELAGLIVAARGEARLASQRRRHNSGRATRPVPQTNRAGADSRRDCGSQGRVREGRTGLLDFAQNVLDACFSPQLWGKYLGAAYVRGVGRSFDDVHNPLRSQITSNEHHQLYQGARQQFIGNTAQRYAPTQLRNVFHEYRHRSLPIANDLLANLRSAPMGKLLPILANAYAQLATLARLAVVRAHADGQCTSLASQGVSNVVLRGEMDCPNHNRVVPVAQVSNHIPGHATCRCAVAPARNERSSPQNYQGPASFRDLLANFDPGQARVPAGQPGGGQWTRGGAGGGPTGGGPGTEAERLAESFIREHPERAGEKDWVRFFQGLHGVTVRREEWDKIASHQPPGEKPSEWSGTESPQPSTGPHVPASGPGRESFPAKDVLGSTGPAHAKSTLNLPGTETIGSAGVTEKKRLGGGANGSYVVTLDNGDKGVWKPGGEEDSFLREGVPSFTQYKREAATYAVARAVGVDDLVPPTTIRVIDGQEGSIQHFEIADTAARKYGNFDGSLDEGAYDGQKDLARSAAFDYLTGNSDRHWKNWMLDDDDKIRLIDNGLTFPINTYDSFINARLFDHAAYLTIPREVAGWGGKWPEIEKALKDTGIEPEAISMTQDRLTQLASAALNGKSFRELPPIWSRRGGYRSGSKDRPSTWHDSAGWSHHRPPSEYPPPEPSSSQRSARPSVKPDRNEPTGVRQERGDKAEAIGLSMADRQRINDANPPRGQNVSQWTHINMPADLYDRFGEDKLQPLFPGRKLVRVEAQA